MNNLIKLLNHHQWIISVFAMVLLAACSDSRNHQARQKDMNSNQSQAQKSTQQSHTQKTEEQHQTTKMDETQESNKSSREMLMSPEQLDEKAPEQFKARFHTSEGTFTVQIHRSWAPKGADRFYNLVKHGYYEGCRFFRVLPGFVVQFGIHGNPKISSKWKQANIKDDPVKKSNRRGTLTFAKAGPNTRTTQVFINLRHNRRLDQKKFPPFGKVTEGMDVVKSLYSGYGKGAPRGNGPSQQKIYRKGNAYLKKNFPKLDHIKKTELLSD